jgi:hypothetical protein
MMIECPGCHRPVAVLTWVGDRAEFAGVVVAENNDPGGTLTSSGGRRGQPGWVTRVVDTDPGTVPGASSSVGRKRLECRGRGHRGKTLSKTVSQEALNASYHRLAGEGRTRVSWLELHT